MTETERKTLKDLCSGNALKCTQRIFGLYDEEPVIYWEADALSLAKPVASITPVTAEKTPLPKTPIASTITSPIITSVKTPITIKTPKIPISLAKPLAVKPPVVGESGDTSTSQGKTPSQEAIFGGSGGGGGGGDVVDEQTTDEQAIVENGKKKMLKIALIVTGVAVGSYIIYRVVKSKKGLKK